MSVYLTLGEAAQQVTVTKSTLHRAINDGRLSASRDAQGHYQIDPAELFRAFDPVKQDEMRDDTEQAATRVGTPKVTVDNESVRWFQQQIEDLQQEKDGLKQENADKENRLVELRKAMAALPSPDDVEAEKEKLAQAHAEQLQRQKEVHMLTLASQQKEQAKAIALEKQAGEKLKLEQSETEKKWKTALADRKLEIKQARAEADQIRQREADQTKVLKAERDRIAALESRGFIARLMNKKPEPAG